jgi:hypothetical protein
VDLEEQLRSLYVEFNARDADAVIAVMAEEVDWPNGWEGGRVVGREAVRDYWLRQWAEVDPHVEPVEITPRADGRLAVEVDQVVKTLDGLVVGEERVVHVYTFDEGLITRMDIEEHAP